MKLTAELSKELSAIEALSDSDKEQLKTLIIDFFAAAAAGYKHNRAFNEAVERAVLPQDGSEESIVLFSGKRLPVRLAAFMNSVYGHGAELDDGNKKAAGHAGVHLIPAVFALAEKLGSTNDDVLVALAVGYEAFIRIASAAQPGMVHRGYHSTGMAGTLACAAACAKLFHLDAQGIENAIALSTTMTGGLLSYGDSRPAIKPLNPGKAAENGVFAAMLANEGVFGPTESLEGPNGWFNAVSDSYDASCLKRSDHLLLHDCYFKLYPSCRHTHCCIDAAAVLHNRLDPAKIKRVNVHIYPNAIKLAGIKLPKDRDETKFSIQYTLARTLINGTYCMDDMEPPRLTREVTELIEKINLIPDGTMEDRSKGIRGARVEVFMQDGESMSETVLIPKGDPENPLTRDDIINKLRSCASGLLNEEAVMKLVSAVLRVDGDAVFINPSYALGEQI